MSNIDENKSLQNAESFDITKYPITTNAFKWSLTSVLLYLLLSIISFMLPSVMILTFYYSALNSNIFENWWRLLLIFLDIMAWWALYLFTTLFLSKLFLILLELIHEPKEGIYKLNKKDPDFYYFCLRVTVKKFIFWNWNNFCFPWVANLAFRVCKMRADFKSTMFDGWSDVEFIEFGKNIMIGQGAVIFSSMIIGDHLIIRKVIIGDHVVIGGNSIVTPGTVIGSGATLGVWASTHINQVLEPDWIYVGRPARKYKLALANYEESKKEPVRRIVDTNEKTPHKINRYVKKDMVGIAIENLDKLYNKWKDTVTKRKGKELGKEYKKSKKEIKKKKKKKFFI